VTKAEREQVDRLRAIMREYDAIVMAPRMERSEENRLRYEQIVDRANRPLALFLVKRGVRVVKP